jgi:HAD superfamily hydrolase (TIGR01509 family)
MVDHVHLSLIGTPKEASDAKLMAHFGDGFDLGRYHETCGALFQKLCAVEIPLKPGAWDLLETLNRLEIPTAVATSASREGAEAQLRRAGVRDGFQAVVTRTDVIHGKPHPESFLKAAGLLGVNPRHCLALEDSYNGVRAASAAGMATIMIPDLLPPIPEIAGLCAGVRPSLSEVRDLVLAAEGLKPAAP